MSQNCRAKHHVFPESTSPCLCPQRPDDYMKRPEPEPLPVVPLAECYELGVIPRPKAERVYIPSSGCSD